MPKATQALRSASKTAATVALSWDFTKGPDRSDLRFGQFIEHNRDLPDADYPPARAIPIAPEKSSGRSTVFYRDPTDGRFKVAEGEGEFRCISRFMADPLVTRIEPQFGPVHYVTAEGKGSHTFFDARVHFSANDNKTEKSVVSSKPKVKAEKYGTDALNKLIFSQMPLDMADHVALITDMDLPAWAVSNYALVQSVRNDGHWLFEQELEAAARSLSSSMSIDEFARPWGGASAVFRTVVMLMFRGLLKEDRPGGLYDETTLIIRTEGSAQ